jgi:outer membrane immunogenic protein
MESDSMRLKVWVVAAALLLAAGVSTAEAQGVRFAPQVSYGDDSELGLGARVRAGLPSLAPGIFLVGSFDYFFPGNDVNYLEVNGNLGYTIPGVRGKIHPYAGGGLNYARVSFDNCSGSGCSNSDIGLNLMGGLDFETSSKITPFVEIRLELSGGEQFVITGGFYF